MSPRLRKQCRALAAVAALMPLLMGSSCGDSGGGATPAQGSIIFEFETWNAREGNPLQVTIRVFTADAFQAFDIDIQGPGQNALLDAALPSAPFDDNGLLFVAPQYNVSTGEIRRIVDFRHGSQSPPGTFVIAEFTMLPLAATPAAVLQFTRVKISDANGVELNIIPESTIFEIKPAKGSSS